MTQIRTAVFPVAGLGTRFLPASKAIPKEMATVVDKPVLQYAVEEARAAGVERFVFVSSIGKSALEDHFDRNMAVEKALEAKGKHALLKAVQDASLGDGEMVVVRQHAPLGLGHAVWCARHVVGDEPFAVLLPDELLVDTPPCLAQMAAAHRVIGDPRTALVATAEVPLALTKKYGILNPAGPERPDKLTPAQGFVEKPDPSAAPSRASIIGRYILPGEIFERLGGFRRGAGDEIQLTDAIDDIARTGGVNGPVWGFRYDGARYDCGTPEGFVRANIACALARPELAEDLREFLSTVR